MAEQQAKDTVRKRAPRAPSDPMQRAVERALKLYEKEGRHVISVDVACQDLGYNGYNNGAARNALATMRQFALINRPSDGQVSVAKEVEDYKFTPDKSQQQLTLVRWLRSPAVYAQLLDKYADHLPSDAQLRYELIKLGFPPDSATEQVGFFKASVQFCDYYNNKPAAPVSAGGNDEPNTTSDQPAGSREDLAPHNVNPVKQREEATAGNFDRIPVRLTGGRRAYLMIPVPLYEEDKERMKAQIDLILADEPNKSGEDLV